MAPYVQPIPEDEALWGSNQERQRSKPRRSGRVSSTGSGSSASAKRNSTAWRKPGKVLRAQLLQQDTHESQLTLKPDCPMSRYIQVSEKVLNEFLHHPVENQDQLMHAYLVGARLETFLHDVLPGHPEYSTCFSESKRQLKTVAQYLEQIAFLIDQQAYQDYIHSVLKDADDPGLVLLDESSSSLESGDSSWARHVAFQNQRSRVEEDWHTVPSPVSKARSRTIARLPVANETSYTSYTTQDDSMLSDEKKEEESTPRVTNRAAWVDEWCKQTSTTASFDPKPHAIVSPDETTTSRRPEPDDWSKPEATPATLDPKPHAVVSPEESGPSRRPSQSRPATNSAVTPKEPKTLSPQEQMKQSLFYEPESSDQQWTDRPKTRLSQKLDNRSPRRTITDDDSDLFSGLGSSSKGTGISVTSSMFQDAAAGRRSRSPPKSRTPKMEVVREERFADPPQYSARVEPWECDFTKLSQKDSGRNPFHPLSPPSRDSRHTTPSTSRRMADPLDDLVKRKSLNDDFFAQAATSKPQQETNLDWTWESAENSLKPLYRHRVAEEDEESMVMETRRLSLQPFRNCVRALLD